MRGRLAIAVAIGILAGGRADAFVLSADELEERSTELGLLIRSFVFGLSGSILRSPYTPGEDADPSGIGLLDLRVSFSHRRPWLKLELHDQLTTTIRSHRMPGPVLGRGLEPARFLPLEVEHASGGLTVRNALDWAFVAVSKGPLTLTLGRQPFTIGRGKLWKPLDLVSTFALTEVDTEYKPGSDAIRIDLTPRSRTVLTLLGSAGRADDQLSLRASAFALRAKQGWAWGEAGLLGGLIRNDLVVGLDAALDLSRFELYGELNLTVPRDESLAPRRPERGPVVVRAVLGATFKPASKLTLSPELYYNGFGAWDPAEYLGVALSERVAQGEIYSLGRLYAAGIALYEAHPLLQLSAALIVNPVDPGALLSLGLSYSLASSVQLAAGGYLPIARRPDLRASAPRSEFGLYPTFLYLELKAAL